MPDAVIYLRQISAPPSRWVGFVEVTDGNGGRHRRDVELSGYEEARSMLETAHHELAPLDPPLASLDAVLDRLEEGIEESQETVEALRDQALEQVSERRGTALAEQIEAMPMADLLEHSSAGAQPSSPVGPPDPDVETGGSDPPPRRGAVPAQESLPAEEKPAEDPWKEEPPPYTREPDRPSPRGRGSRRW